VPRRCPVALKLSVEQRLSPEPENAFLTAGSTWSEFKVFSRVYFVISGQLQFVNIYGVQCRDLLGGPQNINTFLVRPFSRT
jgi:hypothetical protein